jgi:Cof subfamily protein (haloacid dehalogenase superfamily)
MAVSGNRSVLERPTRRDDIRLVIADVDGTLLTPDKVVTRRARAAVRAVVEAGIAFTITSGRPPRGMTMLIEDLELEGPVATFNGGVLVRPDLSTIEEHAVEPDAVWPVIDILTKHGLDVWTYNETDWFVRARHGPHVDREEWTVKFAPTVVATQQLAVERVVKIVGVADDHDAMARSIDEIRRVLGRKISAALSQPYYLDITHPRANKGEIVRTLARLQGIAPSQIATIGDMPNDVLMFERSGLSIAMANASADVQRAAMLVTASNTEEGFALAMERFILQPHGDPDVATA